MQTVAGATIYPTEHFSPIVMENGRKIITRNTYSIHHFDSSWFTPEMQKEKQDRWNRKQKRAREKERRAKLKGVFIKIFGEKLYKKLRD